MIEATTGHVLRELQVRKAELEEAYTPGFDPAHDDIRDAQDKLRWSNNPLSTVAPPESYFVERDAYGRTFYARNGDFRIVDGALRTPNGSAVLGLDAHGGGSLAPLQLDPVDVALHRIENVQIDVGGRLSYVRRVVDPKTSAVRAEQVIVGTIALARFPAGTRAVSADGVHVTAPSGVTPTVGAPAGAGFGALLVHYGDHGAADPKRALAAIRDAYVQYDALQTAEHAHGQGDKTAMDLVK